MDIEAEPAVAGNSIKPGVERSGTPGAADPRITARGAGDRLEFTLKRLSPAPRASIAFGFNWGSAALHPRLYAIARYRGLVGIFSGKLLGKS